MRIYLTDIRRLDCCYTGAGPSDMSRNLSYHLGLQCGCVLYVSRHPETGIVRTRVIRSRGAECCDRRHRVGLRLYLWEILPDRLGRLLQPAPSRHLLPARSKNDTRPS